MASLSAVTMSSRSEENICEQIPSKFCDQPILVSQLDEIAIHLKDWESLAPFISISSPEVEEISRNYCGDYRLQKRMALRTWWEKEGPKATIKQLVCIFCQQGLRDLAEHEVPINDHESLDSHSVVLDSKYKVVELGSILAPSSNRMIVFFEGVGGSGKTTLAWYACKEWAAGTLLQQFQLLIHVQLNDPRLQGLTKLELKDLIPDPNIEAC